MEEIDEDCYLETEHIFLGERIDDPNLVDKYSDRYISLNPLGLHYKRIERIIRDLELMNKSWTEEERDLFNKGVGRYTLHNPIAISHYVGTKNVTQVSRRLYLIEEVMLHRRRLSGYRNKMAAEVKEDTFARETIRSDAKLDQEYRTILRRAPIKKAVRVIDAEVYAKRYNPIQVSHYHPLLALQKAENELKEWLRAVVYAAAGFSGCKFSRLRKKYLITESDVRNALKQFTQQQNSDHNEDEAEVSEEDNDVSEIDEDCNSDDFQKENEEKLSDEDSADERFDNMILDSSLYDYESLCS